MDMSRFLFACTQRLKKKNTYRVLLLSWNKKLVDKLRRSVDGSGTAQDKGLQGIHTQRKENSCLFIDCRGGLQFTLLDIFLCVYMVVLLIFPLGLLTFLHFVRIHEVRQEKTCNTSGANLNPLALFVHRIDFVCDAASKFHSELCLNTPEGTAREK